jgi:peptide/nickel transport system permease protein
MATDVREYFRRPEDNYVLRNLRSGFSRLASKKITLLPLLFLILLLVLAVIGPHITPYQYDETLYNDQGELLRAESPSAAHPLGTTSTGQDVLSRVIYGVQPTVITGLLGGTMIISIGLTMGVVAGYVGGAVDNILMRITDVAYSVPLIPFAIVLLTLLGAGFYSSVIVIGLLLWRGNARVLRSQVLQIKERPYVEAAKAAGASTPRIIVKHILPNVASMAVLFFALGIGYSIVAQAGLSFIGASNPFVPSWGVMIRNAYESGYMADQLGWSMVPGILISMTVLSAFLIGRGFEEDDQAIAEAG